MSLHLYNTATRRKELFEPLRPGRVGMYVCGPTVYDYAHIGNARPVVVFDVLYRLLRRAHESVTYVRNITDVEDKINAAARERGISIAEVTEATTQAYHEDMAALGALPPDEEPRATQHIAHMIAMIRRLIETGHAYEADGHVLFHVPAMAEYGRLSGRNRDEMIAGARIEVAPYKRDPADFVLWKPSDEETPGWTSPWGRGRPGWHIECSAMAKAKLGVTFDIHGGGRDLIFPHHENEVAQSVCANGAPFARYWVHNGFLTVNGEKMSKSLGNFRSVRQVLAQAPGEAARLMLLSTHYRQPLDWSDEGLQQARGTMDRLYGALRHVWDVSLVEAPSPSPELLAALEDDLNTPLALSVLHQEAGRANRAESEEEMREAKSALLGAGELLGILAQEPVQWFRWQPSGAEVDETEIMRLIEQRNDAKKARDFAAADRIREALKAQGILLEDRPGGVTEWRRAG